MRLRLLALLAVAAACAGDRGIPRRFVGDFTARHRTGYHIVRLYGDGRVEYLNSFSINNGPQETISEAGTYTVLGDTAYARVPMGDGRIVQTLRFRLSGDSLITLPNETELQPVFLRTER